MITLAISKGRLLEETLPRLQNAGISPKENLKSTRSLIVSTLNPDVRLLLVRATDVPTYVQHGAADLGIVGSDTLIEFAAATSITTLYQPIDLQLARCRMSVATSVDFDYSAAVRRGARIRVATKYVNIARNFFAEKGVHVDLIKLYGSMELAPLTGLADAIVDLVSTGNTLKANRLHEVEHIMDISARLIVNPASLKLKQSVLRELITQIS